MYPIELLSQEELHDIKDYFSFINHDLPVNDHVLDEWNKNKKTLMRALGGKLKVKIPYTLTLCKKEEDEVYKQTYIYPVIYWYQSFNDVVNQYLKTEKANEIVHNTALAKIISTFVKFVFSTIISREDLSDSDGLQDIARFFEAFFSHPAVYSGIVNIDYDYQFKTIPYTIRANSKTMRALQKILKLIEFEDTMEAYDQWRNQISDIHTRLQSSAKSNLVFSIHPLDYMSISDNSYGWRSCMSNIEAGCYSNGTIELLNSNNVIVAYLEGNEPFYADQIRIPNKRWRQLVIVHRDCIITGKAYPYSQYAITKTVLETMEKLVEENLNWKYDYHCQEYMDMLPYHDLYDVDINYKGTKGIYINTNAFYNDMLQDKDTTYYISRRRIPKSRKINISGKGTCLSCGGSLWDEYESHSGSARKMCHKCSEKYYCPECDTFKDKIYSIVTPFGVKKVCEYCLKNKYCYDTLQNHFVAKSAHNSYIRLLEEDNWSLIDQDIRESFNPTQANLKRIKRQKPQNITNELIDELILQHYERIIWINR